VSKFSDYTETNILQTTLRGIAFPVPSAIYIALFTADPTDANVTAGEVTTAQIPAYARVNAAGAGAIATGWSAPANGVTSNANVITFQANNGTNPVTVTHIGIYDAATVGNLLYHAPLATAKTLQVGDVLSFGVGTLTITVA
jgi:hypothetical protein